MPFRCILELIFGIPVKDDTMFAVLYTIDALWENIESNNFDMTKIITNILHDVIYHQETKRLQGLDIDQWWFTVTKSNNANDWLQDCSNVCKRKNCYSFIIACSNQASLIWLCTLRDTDFKINDAIKKQHYRKKIYIIFHCPVSAISVYAEGARSMKQIVRGMWKVIVLGKIELPCIYCRTVQSLLATIC